MRNILLLVVLLGGCATKRDIVVLTERARATDRRVRYIEFILSHGDPIDDTSWDIK